jgi:hypothetical protein
MRVCTGVNDDPLIAKADALIAEADRLRAQSRARLQAGEELLARHRQLMRDITAAQEQQFRKLPPKNSN